MKKVLYISDCILEKNIGSYQLCCSHLESLKTIVGEENVDVIALTGRTNYSSIDTGYTCFQGYSNKFEKLMNFISLNNPFINNKISNQILECIERNKYDIVFIDSSGYGKLVKKIKKRFSHIKILSFYHDVKRNLCKLWLKEYGIKYLPDYIVNIYNETLNVKYCDYNITLNERESSIYKKYYKKEPDLELPIYFKSPQIKHIDQNKDVCANRMTLLFVGAYYYPNVKGIKWFIEEVMPKLNSNIYLEVVGRGIDQIKDEINPSFITNQINIIGEVESLADYYLNSSIVIAPIFEGAGMKVKTAEALSYGKQIIGTTEALEGYKQLTEVCDTKEEFISKINQLYEERTNLESFDSKMYNIFKENYSLEVANDKLEKLINS